LETLRSPFANAHEIVQEGYLYGEKLYFSPQTIDIHISFHRKMTTSTRTFGAIQLQGQEYDVISPTYNNGILFFPSNQDSLKLAYEIQVVYERMMEIYPCPFNDLNATSCAFQHHPELNLQVMIPYRIYVNQSRPQTRQTHYDLRPIELTHYFTTNWIYYGSQSDHGAYERIISVLADLRIEPSSELDLTPVIGPPPDPCENVIERIFFPKCLLGLFHPRLDASSPSPSSPMSFVMVLRNAISKQLGLHRYTILLSYLVVLLIAQHQLWTDLYFRSDRTIEWYDPVSGLLDINRVRQEVVQSGVNVGQIETIASIPVIAEFYKIARTRFPVGFLLTPESTHYCPPMETLIDDISRGDPRNIIKYKDQIDPNLQDSMGRTLIHHCVCHKQIVILQYLLSGSGQTVDLGKRDLNGDTALSIATNEHLTPFIQMLQRKTRRRG
jgi:hypothetical protein